MYPYVCDFIGQILEAYILELSDVLGFYVLSGLFDGCFFENHYGLTFVNETL